MIQVTQTVFHRPADRTYFAQVGNCFRACMASILEIGIDDMPPFELTQTPGTYITLAQAWGITEGHGKLALFPRIDVPQGYSIGSGQSPRAACPHAVVCLDGVPVWDPHPSREGLTGDPTLYFAFRPVAAAEVAPAVALMKKGRRKA